MSTDPTNSFTTSQVRPWDKPQTENSIDIKLAPNPPSFPLGLTALDIDKSHGIRIKAFTDNVTPNSVRVHLDAWADTTLYMASCNWLEVFANDREFQHGSVSTMDDHPWNKPQVTTAIKVNFPKAFGAPPTVIVWLNELDLNEKHNWRVKATVSDVTSTGFIMHLDTWGDTIMYSATATWIAYPANRPNIMSGSYNIMDVRAWDQPRAVNQGNVQFNKALQTVPRVLSGLNMMDIGCSANLRIRLGMSNISKTGLTWNIDAWADTVLYSAGASYLAIQEL
ncbi:hypothetical protein Hypma_000219 [Hypsizygus marmoreus]|uniref:H-type lectin domain-containing protein n=1 Tax=Hypsizygus marmoreus TaxID=39966 RepID=A0A369JGG2_HYPMA|nr:hypothetical protein Hypma_000219 [Hypsizygus marmoreus]